MESLEETRAGSSGEEDTGREKMLAYNSPSSFPGHAYEKRLLPLNVKQEKINEQPKMEKPAEPQKENKVIFSVHNLNLIDRLVIIYRLRKLMLTSRKKNKKIVHTCE